MIKSFSVLIIVAILLVFGGCKKKNTNSIYDNSYKDEIELTRKDFMSYMARNHIPGGNIAIAKEGNIIYSEGIGLASKDLDVPMTRHNLLRIGDVSQLFTSIIYLKLVEEGILDPDSTVQHYIPEYPETDFKLALKYLPYHTSGIRKQGPSESELPGLNPSIQKGLESFMNDDLTSPPGWYEEVSMFNTNLLGAVMERATKKKFPVLLKEYVTDTLQLANTIVDNSVVPIEGRADFYDQNMLGQVINAPFHDTRYKAPSFGILSNAEDLAKLGIAILESDYFSEEFTEKLFEPCNLYGNYKSKMANGWILTIDEQGRDVNASSGSVMGGGAAILMYPEEELVIAYAVNLTIGNNMLPVFEIANHFLQD
ncbi:MAG: serine hydrolase domain-containing protein [Bacteroidota bacterium]